MIDLQPAAQRLADLVRSIPDGGLDAPTPCPSYALGDLLDHVTGFCAAFTAAATKTSLDTGSKGQTGDASRLEADWRAQVFEGLDGLAAAWADPDAWTGMTHLEVAGDLPGEVAGMVALDELVVHGWDVARALGRPCTGADADAALLVPFVSGFEGPRSVDGPFAPIVDIAANASPLDRLLGLTGRDPGWAPA